LVSDSGAFKAQAADLAAQTPTTPGLVATASLAGYHSRHFSQTVFAGAGPGELPRKQRSARTGYMY
jgi:hypothetical protein